MLLVVDETAVPAFSAILEILGTGVTGHAVLEVPEAADMVDLCVPCGVEVSWLIRGQGRHGERLISSVREVCPPAAHLAATCSSDELQDVDIDRELLWETSALQSSSAEDLSAWIAGEAC